MKLTGEFEAVKQELQSHKTKKFNSLLDRIYLLFRKDLCSFNEAVMSIKEHHLRIDYSFYD